MDTIKEKSADQEYKKLPWVSTLTPPRKQSYNAIIQKAEALALKNKKIHPPAPAPVEKTGEETPPPRSRRHTLATILTRTGQFGTFTHPLLARSVPEETSRQKFEKEEQKKAAALTHSEKETKSPVVSPRIASWLHEISTTAERHHSLGSTAEIPPSPEDSRSSTPSIKEDSEEKKANYERELIDQLRQELKSIGKKLEENKAMTQEDIDSKALADKEAMEKELAGRKAILELVRKKDFAPYPGYLKKDPASNTTASESKNTTSSRLSGHAPK